MAMKNPPHPGGLVLRQCIEPLGLSITQAATALGVTRTTLSELVNGNAVSLRKWPCAYRKCSGEARKAGLRSKLTTNFSGCRPAASSSSVCSSREAQCKGAGKLVTKLIEEFTDVYGFLFWQWL